MSKVLTPTNKMAERGFWLAVPSYTMNEHMPEESPLMSQPTVFYHPLSEVLRSEKNKFKPEIFPTT